MFKFLIMSLMLGVGLAMDACAVSMTNGFSEPKMKTKKIILIAGMFGLFQGVMPLIGYFIGYSVIQYIEKYIPWIALILLSYIGGKMIFDSIKENRINRNESKKSNDEKVDNEICQKTEIANSKNEEVGDLENQETSEGENSKNIKKNGNEKCEISFKTILVQAIATSIDALSVGLTIADYKIKEAIICVTIIAIVTFVISFVAVHLGKKFGTKLGAKAEIVGGIILILIGLEIFFTGIF